MFHVLLTKNLKKHTGRSAVNDTSVACFAALLRTLRRRSCGVSNTINIIIYTDFLHDWRVGVGMGVLWDCWGELGLEG